MQDACLIFTRFKGETIDISVELRPVCVSEHLAIMIFVTQVQLRSSFVLNILICGQSKCFYNYSNGLSVLIIMVYKVCTLESF